MSILLTWLLVLMTVLLCVGIWIGPALIALWPPFAAWTSETATS